MVPVDSIAEHVECNESIQSCRVPTLPQSCRVPTLPLDSLGSNVLRYI